MGYLRCQAMRDGRWSVLCGVLSGRKGGCILVYYWHSECASKTVGYASSPPLCNFHTIYPNYSVHHGVSQPFALDHTYASIARKALDHLICEL